MMLNTAEMSLEEAAEAIVHAAQRKSAQRQSAPAGPDEIIARVQRLQRRPNEPRVSEVVWRFCQRRQRSPL